MPRKTQPLIPATEELLIQLGERLRLARLRRHLTGRQVAERAGMAPMTLRSLERGSPAVTMGAYTAVMQVLGVEEDLNLLALEDPTGRSLQDARLSRRRPARVPRSLPTATTVATSGRVSAERPRRSVSIVPSAVGDETRRTLQGFTSTKDLMRLLDVGAVKLPAEGSEK